MMAVLLVSASLGACERSSTAPDPLVGSVYHLRTVNDRALPAVYDSSAVGVYKALSGDVTFVYPDSVRIAWRVFIRFRPSATDPYQEFTAPYESTFRFTRRGNTLTLSNPCEGNPLADCIPSPRVFLGDDHVVVTNLTGNGIWTFVSATM
jgi:hypothetical protein